MAYSPVKKLHVHVHVHVYSLYVMSKCRSQCIIDHPSTNYWTLCLLFSFLCLKKDFQWFTCTCICTLLFHITNNYYYVQILYNCTCTHCTFSTIVQYMHTAFIVCMVLRVCVFDDSCFFIIAVFRVVSAVLHFGNLEFKQEISSDQALLPDYIVAQKISKLLGISVTDFTKALLKPKIKTGREFTVRSQSKAQVRQDQLE